MIPALAMRIHGAGGKEKRPAQSEWGTPSLVHCADALDPHLTLSSSPSRTPTRTQI